MHMFSESMSPDFMPRTDMVFQNLPTGGERITGRIQGKSSNETQK